MYSLENLQTTFLLDNRKIEVGKRVPSKTAQFCRLCRLLTSHRLDATSHAEQITMWFIPILICRGEILCTVCAVHIKLRKQVLDRAGNTAPTGQHEPDQTGHEPIRSAWLV